MTNLLPPTPATATTRCRVSFGRTASALERCPRGFALGVALPVLAGASEEQILSEASVPTQVDGCTLFRSADRVAGFCVADATADLETAARDLYRRIFSVTRGLHLYRLWNYVPRINAVEHDLENYRRFCRGRSLAFEQHFGHAFTRALPAASGVGTPGGPLALAFLAGTETPHHFENPRQVPAFEYPSLYGPRPPSFSRATLIADAQGRDLFISGTAAIRGHASVAVNDLSAQLACTRENLAVIAATAGAGPNFGADRWQRHLKVYLRHAEDLAATRADLERHLLRPTDTVSYLQADLCRSELLVEIEAVLSAPSTRQ